MHMLPKRKQNKECDYSYTGKETHLSEPKVVKPYLKEGVDVTGVAKVLEARKIILQGLTVVWLGKARLQMWFQ